MLPTGLVLNQRYRIDSLLGQGGFGAVYYAYELNLNGPVAIKENFDASPQAQKQFVQEASLLFNLRHPHLPRVLDQFTIPGQGQYLVMDFIEGEDLEEMLIRRNAPLPEALIGPWIGQVCDALSYLHSRTPPIIHRDVKPANIRISREGEAFLVDFGVAKQYDPIARTLTGARAVTPGYAPFEQYGQRRTDARSDVYAFGATLYHLLTNQIPPESIDRVAGMALTPPRQLNPAISPSVEAAILRALEIQPDSRFQNVAEIKLALFSSSPARVMMSDSPVQTSPAAPSAPATASQPLPDQPASETHQPVSGRLSSAPSGPAAASIPPPAIDQSDSVPQSGEAVRPTMRVAGRRLPANWIAAVGLALLIVAAGLYWALQPTREPEIQSAAVVTTATNLSAASAEAAVTEAVSATVDTPEATLVPALTDDWGAEMVLIPTGDFQMGSENGSDDEKPVRSVYVDAFYMDIYEVSNDYFATFLEENRDQANSFSNWIDLGQEWVKIHDEGSVWHAIAGFESYPVVGSTWLGAKTYCEWRGARLPTEAEWEKAARGGLVSAEYPWGNQAPTCGQGETSDAQFGDCGDSLVEAGDYGPNGFGLYDMAGNAWEWVADWYQRDYYAESPAENPTGPESGEHRVLRGGAWGATAAQLRVAYRERFDPGASDDYIGFRCGRTP